MHATTAAAQVSAKALAEDLLALWHHLMKGSSPQLYAVLEELDLSLTQIKTLHVLEGCVSEVSVKELGTKLGLSLPAASRTIDALLRRGWLERREDDADRRIRRVRITPVGSDVVRRIDGARLAGIEQFTATLRPEQRQRLAAALADLPYRSDTED